MSAALSAFCQQENVVGGWKISFKSKIIKTFEWGKDRSPKEWKQKALFSNKESDSGIDVGSTQDGLGCYMERCHGSWVP